MSKKRFKIQVDYFAKKQRLLDLKRFNVSQVSSNPTKDGNFIIYFSVRNKNDEDEILEFLRSVKIKYEDC